MNGKIMDDSRSVKLMSEKRSLRIMALNVLNNVALLIIGALVFDGFGIEIAALTLLLIRWTEAAASIFKSISNISVLAIGSYWLNCYTKFLTFAVGVILTVAALVYVTAAYLINLTGILAIAVYVVVDFLPFRHPDNELRFTILPNYLRSSRYIISALIYWILISHGVATSDNVVICVVMPLIATKISIFLVFASNRDYGKRSKITYLSSPNSEISSVGYILRWIEILILPAVFDIKHVGIYIMARIFSETVRPLFLHLLQAGSDLLRSRLKFSVNAGFVSAAARLNLGLFLIGGGISMIPLALGKFYGPAFGDDQQLFAFCLFFSVTGHYGKALLGACEEVLRLTARRSELVSLQSMSILLFVAYCFYSEDLSLRGFALSAAVMHIGLAAVFAGIVAYRFGIWPGPTAILFRQIRLFQRTKNSA
jgi:hypothetical protein